MRYINLSCFAMSMPLLLATPLLAQTTGNYSAPTEFMDLFFDFTGSKEPDYPAGQPTLGQMLTQAAVAKESGKRCSRSAGAGRRLRYLRLQFEERHPLGQQRFRADRASGFYELTAISHIGPALAYLAQIKANGDARWKARLASLRTHVAQVRTLNQRAANNWLDLLNQPAWSARKAQIRTWWIMPAHVPCTISIRSVTATGFTVAGRER